MDNDKIDRLERLARLRETGALSDAEFEAQKRRILDDPSAPVEVNTPPSSMFDVSPEFQTGRSKPNPKGMSAGAIVLILLGLFIATFAVSVAIIENKPTITSSSDGAIGEAESSAIQTSPANLAVGTDKSVENGGGAFIAEVCDDLGWGSIYESRLLMALSQNRGIAPGNGVFEIARNGGLSWAIRRSGDQCVVDVRLSGSINGTSYRDSGRCAVTGITVSDEHEWMGTDCKPI